MEANDNPFEVLGIAPTADSAAVRRAYFAAVQRHPPHADAAAFRRVRAAYEKLSTAAGRRAAVVLAAVDVAGDLAPLRQRFDAALADVFARASGSRRDRDLAQRFAQEASRVSWAERARIGAPARPR